MNEMIERFCYSICLNYVDLYDNPFDQTPDIKYVRIKVIDIGNSEDSDNEGDEDAFANIVLRFYSPLYDGESAMVLFDIDHADTLETARAIQRNKNICFDDMQLIVYLEDIEILSGCSNECAVKSFLYANLKEIIHRLTWIEPDCIMFCAQNKDEEWVRGAIELNPSISYAGIGKASDPNDQLRFYVEMI